MKIGTDGVLLGAWAPIKQQPYSILDIGTGTGIIALILAQRSNATQIDALEIEENAYEQATDNFENSPWNDRLFCFHAGLDEFMEEPEDEYDLIVSNPPFYAEDFKTNDDQRDLARFQDALPFEDLIEAADLLLSENGIFAVIIPFKEEERFLTIANEFELYPMQIVGSNSSHLDRNFLSSVFSSGVEIICLSPMDVDSSVPFLSIMKHIFCLVVASSSAIDVISAFASLMVVGVSAPKISISISR